MLFLPAKANNMLRCILLITAIGTCNNLQSQNRERVIDSLTNLLQQSKADTNRARLYIMIGDRYEQRNDSISIDYYYKAIALSEQLKYKWGEAVARQYLAEVYLRKNKYDSSTLHLTKVMELSQALKDDKRMGVAANTIAIIHYRNGDFENALTYYLRAAEHFEKREDLRIQLISCYTNIGSVFFEQGQHDKALDYNKRAYDIAVQIKNDIEIAYAACELAAALQKHGKAKEAKVYIQQAVTIANKEEDLFLKTVAWQNLGTAHLQENNYHDALAAFNQALNFAQQYGDSTRIALLLGFTGQTQTRLNNYPAAEQNLLTALRYYTNAQDLTGLSKIYDALYNLETAKGNYKKGVEFLQLYHRYKDTVFTLDRAKSLNGLEARYQSEKKEREIAQLNVQRVEQELIITQRNRWLLVVAMSLGLVLIFAILYYKNSRQKMVIAKQQQVLQEEKISSLQQQQQVIALQSMVNGQETERRRIARDLHDSLGGLFSTVKMHFSSLQHEVADLRGNTLYKKSYELVDDAAEELRKIAHNMMPEVLLKIGLVPALQDFCNNINAGKRLHISLQAYGMEKRLNASTEVIIYRIIQELVNNIIKHAQATEAIIQFNRNGSNLSITVEDNGRGFDTLEAEEKHSMGIQTVKSRVVCLNGRIAIDSQNNVGTTVMIDLVLSEEA
jgi:two-component system, NarL family, sensor kinase